MKRKMFTKEKVFLVSFLTLLLSFNNFALAIAPDNPRIFEQQTPATEPMMNPQENNGSVSEFVPGEVLVKFKEGGDPNAAPGVIDIPFKGIERIYSIESVITKFKENYKLEKDSDGWYWFRGKNYQRIGDISDDKLFREAYVQMTPAEKALYRTYKVTLPEGMRVEDAVEFLERNPNVEYAEPNYIATTQMAPNDPYYHSQGSWKQEYDDLWGIKLIDSEDAWDLTQGEGVIVAVIDTGVDYIHEDLKGNIWVNPGEDLDGNGVVDDTDFNGLDDDGNGYIDDLRGWDFVTFDDGRDDNDPMDKFGHGTHVAGTIAAVGNNDIGIIGVAPKAKIMAIKGLSDGGSGSVSDLVNAVKYAADNGAHVTNNSWGGRGKWQAMADAFNYAHEKGLISIASAGNSSMDVVNFSPANIETVVAVAASTHKDERCSFSNYGEMIDVAAPGGGYANEQGRGSTDIYNVLSSMPDDSVIAFRLPAGKVGPGYWRLAGTSMACPHVAGVTALILSHTPNVSNEDARTILRFFSDDVGKPGKDDFFGYGRVNAHTAVSVGRVSISVTSPAEEGFVHGNTPVTGTAYFENGFERYELYWATRDKPEVLNPITGPIYTPVEFEGSLIPEEINVGFWDTTQAEEGDAYLILKAYTTEGVEVTAAIEVKIDNINEYPEIVNLTDKSTLVGRLSEFQVEAFDPDDPETPQGQLSYSVGELPPNAHFDPQTQIFSWQPDKYAEKTYEVTFTVSDNELSTSQTITLTTIFVYIEETVIDVNVGTESRRIYDNVITWSEYVKHDSGWGYAIFVYDIETSQKKQITSGPRNDESPAIHGDKIVWRSYYYDSANSTFYFPIFMYDISTGEISTVYDEPGVRYPPDIFENRIVWVEYNTPDPRSWSGNIYMYDISTDEVTQLTFDSEDPWKRSARIDGDTVTWIGTHIREDGRSQYDVSMYDFNTAQISRITDDEARHGKTSVQGDRIVYDSESFQWDTPISGSWKSGIYMYDIPLDEITKITPDVKNATRSSPDIYEDLIVWTGWTDTKRLSKPSDLGEKRQNDQVSATSLIFLLPNYQNFMHNVSTGEQFPMTFGSYTAYIINFNPSIYQDKVVWNRAKYEYKDGWLKKTEDSIILGRVYFVPQIDSINPTEAAPGDILTLTGKRFGYSKGKSEVVFTNGIVAPIESWSNTEIVCQVPYSAKSGPVKVSTPAGDSNDVHFDVVRPPVIYFINPESGRTGDRVTIEGKDFGEFSGDIDYNPNCDLDKDGDVDATDLFGVFMPSYGTVRGDAAYNPLCDFDMDGDVDDTDLFGVFMPSYGSLRGGTYVEFHNKNGAKIIEWSDTKIVCEVPLAAESGNIYVTTAEGVSNGVYFTVLTPPIIFTVTPSSGKANDRVTIEGKNFGEFSGNMNYNPNCDFDKDGDVDATDLRGVFMPSFGTLIGDAAYNPLCDFDMDGDVDVTDLFGVFMPSYGTERGDTYVEFHDKRGAKIIEWSDTKIVCEVPLAAESGNIYVTTPEGVSNGFYFTILNDAPLISIEMEGRNVWELNRVRMGELSANVDASGNTLHRIKNTGNVPVNVEIKYGPLTYGPWQRTKIKPGMKQGVDTFITKVRNKVLPPAEGIAVGRIEFGEAAPLSLTYGAPTKVSDGAEGHYLTYELRAYKAAE